MGYIANFIVYTLAMLGVIVFALFVFKKTTVSGCGRASKHLRVIDSMSLGQRKMLYIIEAGKEKFLIAGDVDKTSLISKLELNSNENEMVTSKQALKEETLNTKQTFQDTMKSLPQFSYLDRSILGKQNHKTSQNAAKNGITTSVMRNLAERMKN